MGFWSSVGSLCSSVVDSVCNAVSKVGSEVSSFVAKVAPTVIPIITTSSSALNTICRFASAFLQSLNIFKAGETVEDLGDRALQAAEKGITPDKFKNFDEYMDSLRNFNIDPDVSSKTSDVIKVVSGLGVSTLAVEDKFNAERGSLNGIWLLPIANSAYFTPERMESLLKTDSLKGDVLSYLDKNLAAGESRNFEKKLAVDSDGTPLSGQKLDDLHDALDSAREKWVELGKQVEARNNPDSAT